MIIVVEPQLLPTAIGTLSGSIISGMHNHTTGPKVSPKLAIKITSPTITNAFPTLESVINPIEMITLDITNTIVPSCRRVFLPNLDNR